MELRLVGDSAVGAADQRRDVGARGAHDPSDEWLRIIELNVARGEFAFGAR